MRAILTVLALAMTLPILPAITPAGAARAQTTETPAPQPSTPVPRPPRSCSPAPPTS